MVEVRGLPPFARYAKDGAPAIRSKRVLAPLFESDLVES